MVGRNVFLENRFPAEQYERFNSFASELVALNVDVLIAVTPPAALAAQRATSRIPVIFILVPDPVRLKLEGTKPAELPVELPTRYTLAINLQTAKQLGLVIPQAVLLRTDVTL